MSEDRSPFQGLSRRERQILQVVYAEGEASVRDVMERIPDPPTYNAVRGTLRNLEEKGHVVHEQEGPRYVYRPATPVSSARRAALKSLVETFFDGSLEDAVVALLKSEGSELSEAQVERLRKMIDEAEAEGR